MTDERRPKAPPENPTPPQEGVGAMVPRTDDEQAPLTEQAARVLTSRIQILAKKAVGAFADLREELVRAYRGRVWLALGLASWEEYCERHLQPYIFHPKLSQDRREIVSWLAAEGLSTRAIAPVVGAGRSTVSRDLAAGVPSGTPDRWVTGRDAKTYTVRLVPNPDATDEELVAEHLGLDRHRRPDPDEQRRREAVIVEDRDRRLDKELSATDPGATIRLIDHDYNYWAEQVRLKVDYLVRTERWGDLQRWMVTSWLIAEYLQGMPNVAVTAEEGYALRVELAAEQGWSVDDHGEVVS